MQLRDHATSVGREVIGQMLAQTDKEVPAMYESKRDL